MPSGLLAQARAVSQEVSISSIGEGGPVELRLVQYPGHLDLVVLVPALAATDPRPGAWGRSATARALSTASDSPSRTIRLGKVRLAGHSAPKVGFHCSSFAASLSRITLSTPAVATTGTGAPCSRFVTPL